MNARVIRRLVLAIALALAAFLAWWNPRGEPAPRSLSQSDAPETDDWSPTDERPRDPGPAGSPAPHAPEQRSCQPHAERGCQDGDVHWFDSCGIVEELSEACEGRGCSEGRCAAAANEDPCGRLSSWGECLGDIAQACIDKKIVAVDCAARRLRCVMTSEGAACLPRDDKNGCRGYEPATCNGTQLRVCADGRWRTIDCAARKGVCSDTAQGAHCELNAPLALGPLAGPGGEQCDGVDNDGDGEIDEGATCDPIPLVPFIPEGAKLRDLEARMADELSILNHVLTPISFRWAKPVPVSSSYRAFDPDNLEALAAQLGQSESRIYQAKHGAPLTAAGEPPASFDFYIPVLYTERLKLDPPKSGISTLPNAHCGGVRLSDTPSPVSGLIVISEARQPETLTHELGHYLGLCHTHEQVSHFSAPYPDEPACEYTGDSICDTPDDPGPTQCFQAEPCVVTCRQPARPDPFNIMSYYIPCRRLLTPEQIAEMRRNLNLRRGWFRCQDPHDCPCDPKKKLACPTEMSCHPAQKSDAPWMCELDGPALPGASCSSASHCSLRSFCIGKSDGSSRCVRPCDEEPGCTCQDVGLGFRVCGEDL